jgi:hypothetical protein
MTEFNDRRPRRENVATMTSGFQFADGPDWKSVQNNYNFKDPKMRAIQEDIRRRGVREPIPVDYEQTPPKVIDGHTRLALAERAGLKKVPVEHHDEFDYYNLDKNQDLTWDPDRIRY